MRNSTGCSEEEAQRLADAYANGFKGIAAFKEKGSALVRKNGYVTLCPRTGHKTWWQGHREWLDEKKQFTKAFWDEYRQQHKGTGDSVAKFVSGHFKTASKWDRKALNSPTQGQGAVILKDSQVKVFKWVVSHGYFGKILLCNLTHDEANWEYPKEIEEFPKVLKDYMEASAAQDCKSLPIPAEAEVDVCWRH